MATETLIYKVIIESKGSIKNVDDLIKRQKELKKQITSATDVGSKKFKQLEDQFKKNNQALLQFNRNLRGSKSLTSNVAGGMIKSFKAVGVALLAAFSVRAIFSTIKDAIGIFIGFEQAMADVRAVTLATNEEFDKLNKQAIQLGGTTKFTATEIAGLQKELAKLGFSIDEIVAATPAVQNLAAATGEDLAKSALVAGATIRAFGLDASETQRVVDVMALSFSSSALDLEKFAVAMRSVAPAAESAGFNVEQTTAKLAQLVDRGVDASTAGSALRNIFIELSRQGLTFNEAMEKINNSTDKNLTSFNLFGKRGAVVATILSKTRDAADGLEKALNMAGGTAQRMADIQLNTLQGRLTLLNSAWDGYILSVFDSDSATIKLISGVTELTTSILNTAAGVKTSVKAFEDQTIKVRDLETNLLPLLDRYDELTNKNIVLTDETRLTKEEQAELEKIIRDVSEVIPNAVTEFNSYGIAMGIATNEARSFFDQQVEVNKILQADAIKEHKDEIDKLNASLESEALTLTKVNGEWKLGVENINGRLLQTKAYLEITPKIVNAINAERGAIQKQIDTREAAIRSLTGEQTAKEIAAIAAAKLRAEEDAANAKAIAAEEEAARIAAENADEEAERIKKRIENIIKIAAQIELLRVGIEFFGLNELGIRFDKELELLEIKQQKELKKEDLSEKEKTFLRNKHKLERKLLDLEFADEELKIQESLNTAILKLETDLSVSSNAELGNRRNQSIKILEARHKAELKAFKGSTAQLKSLNDKQELERKANKKKFDDEELKIQDSLNTAILNLEMELSVATNAELTFRKKEALIILAARHKAEIKAFKGSAAQMKDLIKKQDLETKALTKKFTDEELDIRQSLNERKLEIEKGSLERRGKDTLDIERTQLLARQKAELLSFQGTFDQKKALIKIHEAEVVDLEADHQKSREEIEKQNRDKAIASFRSLIDEISAAQQAQAQQRIDALTRDTDARLADFDERQRRELESFTGTEKEKTVFENDQAEIRRKFEEEQEAKLEQIKIEAAKKQQDIAATQALISGALAIQRIAADFPKLDFGAATIAAIIAQIALTAAQVAAIKGQTFEKGGQIQVPGMSGGMITGPSHANGGVPIWLGEAQGNEYILNQRATKMFLPIIEWMNQQGLKGTASIPGAVPFFPKFQEGGLTPRVSGSPTGDFVIGARDIVEAINNLKLTFSNVEFDEQRETFDAINTNSEA